MLSNTITHGVDGYETHGFSHPALPGLASNSWKYLKFVYVYRLPWMAYIPHQLSIITTTTFWSSARKKRSLFETQPVNTSRISRHFPHVQIAWVSLRGTSIGATINDVNTKQPSLKNGRNCSFKPSFCCRLLPFQRQRLTRNCFRVCCLGWKVTTSPPWPGTTTLSCSLALQSWKRLGGKTPTMCRNGCASWQAASPYTVCERPWEGGGLWKLHRHLKVWRCHWSCERAVRVQPGILTGYRDPLSSP